MAGMDEQAGDIAISVGEFEWDEKNEAHCARHNVTPSIGEQKRRQASVFLRTRPAERERT
jgi:hypothetical protein